MKSLFRSQKFTVIRFDVISKDIHRIWSSTQSPYALGKNYLFQAKMCMYSDSKKAYKLIRKARREFRREATVAFKYNRMGEVIRQSSDPGIVKVNEAYREALTRGDYSRASKMVKKLSMESVVKKSVDPMEIAFLSMQGCDAAYQLKNVSNSDVTVTKMEFASGSRRLSCDTSYPFVIPGNTSCRVRVVLEKGDREIRAFVEYRDGEIIRNAELVNSSPTPEEGAGNA